MYKSNADNSNLKIHLFQHHSKTINKSKPLQQLSHTNKKIRTNPPIKNTMNIQNPFQPMNQNPHKNTSNTKTKSGEAIIKSSLYPSK